MSEEIKYSIVIPVYKSGPWLEDLTADIRNTMQSLGSFEIILVNDKSPDHVTWPEIVRLARQYSDIRGLNMMYNVGQFKGTLCGMEIAEGEYILTMDDDFQHPPEELGKLISAMRQHPEMDCIMGCYTKKNHSFLRNLGSVFMQRITRFLYHKQNNIVTTSFRIMKRNFAKTLVLYKTGFPQLGPLIVSLSGNLMNVSVEHQARPHGKSGYSFSRCIRETFQSVINASVFPLRLLSVTGTSFAIMAFGISFYFLIRWLLFGSKVPGYTSLILAVCFFSGLILLGIGLLGEYIGRMIHEVTGLPRYQIAEDTREKRN